MDEYMKRYIGKLLRELDWDLNSNKIIKFKSRKGLYLTRKGKKIEKIFIIREIE